MSGSFVDVRKVFFEYQATPGLLARLSGKPAQVHSVLRDVSFGIGHGETVTVFGKEGAGKSTLLRLLAGGIFPTKGQIVINGQATTKAQDLAAGYVSAEESEPKVETGLEILQAFAATHKVPNAGARIGALTAPLHLEAILTRSAVTLSTAERLRLNIARAALSDTPLVLFDDVADALGAEFIKTIVATLFVGRTVLLATRSIATAESLGWPLLLLHNASLVHAGTCDEIANDLACPRTLEVWVEGLRYDFLRKLRQQSWVHEVRLMPSSRFAGQKLRITLHSSRYLPSLYDVISQAPLIKVNEVPPSLAEIVARL